MNESTLTSLKVFVERIVRPIAATIPRKLRMREELLAHLIAVYYDESSKLPDEQLTLSRTQERFGDSTQIRSQLQESIPLQDQWAAYVAAIFAGRTISTWQLALRYTVIAFLPAVFLLIAYQVQGRLAEWPIALAFPFMTFASVYLIRGMISALCTPDGISWGKVIAICGASAFMTSSVVFAICLVFSGNWRSSLEDALVLLPMGIVVPVIMLLGAFFIIHRKSKLDEWMQLIID